jgi:hypothetical protein
MPQRGQEPKAVARQIAQHLWLPLPWPAKLIARQAPRMGPICVRALTGEISRQSAGRLAATASPQPGAQHDKAA